MYRHHPDQSISIVGTCIPRKLTGSQWFFENEIPIRDAMKQLRSSDLTTELSKLTEVLSSLRQALLGVTNKRVIEELCPVRMI